MNIIHTLNKKLLEQPFEEETEQAVSLTQYQHIAFTYSIMENSIAVLSDLKSRKSYIYNGGVALRLGISEKKSIEEIDSIWEEKIFSRIHPDDLLEKHLLELQFFHFLKDMPLSERLDYYIVSQIRMRDNSNEYVAVQHRMFYASSHNSMRLALCIYNLSENNALSNAYDGRIINSATGVSIKQDKKKCNDILSVREKEILRLIAKGKMSKEIAGSLSISINTVNRHRQNILEKLRVKNSIEACRVAELMEIL